MAFGGHANTANRVTCSVCECSSFGTFEMFTFSPLAFLGIGLVCALPVAIWQVLHHVSHRKDKVFGFAGLTLVALLDVIAFVGGFTIGWGLALLNIALGLTFAVLAKHYRPAILFASLISLLLALFMRGHFLPAREILEVLLLIVGIGGGTQIVRNWLSQKAQNIGTQLVMVACLGFLSLLLGDKRELATGLAVLVSMISIWIAMSSGYYRWYFLLISASCLLWVINLLKI